MEETEPVLIAQCLGGDQRAWQRLVERFQQPVARQMWRFSRERAVWEDLVQDVFVELYRSLPRYRHKGVPLEHWLRRIAVRVGYRHWKTQARQRAVVHEPLLAAAAVAAAPPVEAMQASEAAHLLHGLLSRLAAKDRLVLTLTYLDECDTREVARRTGWNRAAVKMRLMRARRKLRLLVDAGNAHLTAGSVPHGHQAVD